MEFKFKHLQQPQLYALFQSITAELQKTHTNYKKSSKLSAANIISESKGGKKNGWLLRRVGSGLVGVPTQLQPIDHQARKKVPADEPAASSGIFTHPEADLRILCQRRRGSMREFSTTQICHVGVHRDEKNIETSFISSLILSFLL